MTDGSGLLWLTYAATGIRQLNHQIPSQDDSARLIAEARRRYDEERSADTQACDANTPPLLVRAARSGQAGN